MGRRAKGTVRILPPAAMAFRSAKLILPPAAAQITAGAIGFFAAAHRPPSTHVVQRTCLGIGQIMFHARFVEINIHDLHGYRGHVVKAVALKVAFEKSIS